MTKTLTTFVVTVPALDIARTVRATDQLAAIAAVRNHYPILRVAKTRISAVAQ